MVYNNPNMRIPSREIFVQKFKAFLTENPKTLITRREDFSSKPLNRTLPIDWFFEVKETSAKFHLESQEEDAKKFASLCATLFPGEKSKLTLDFLLKHYGKISQMDYRVNDFEVKRAIPRKLEAVDPTFELTPSIKASLIYRTYLDFIIKKLEECKKHGTRPGEAVV